MQVEEIKQFDLREYLLNPETGELMTIKCEDIVYMYITSRNTRIVVYTINDEFIRWNGPKDAIDEWFRQLMDQVDQYDIEGVARDPVLIYIQDDVFLNATQIKNIEVVYGATSFITITMKDGHSSFILSYEYSDAAHAEYKRVCSEYIKRSFTIPIDDFPLTRKRKLTTCYVEEDMEDDDEEDLSKRLKSLNVSV